MPQLPCEGNRELNELVSNKECANMHTLVPVLPPEITPWINMPDRREWGERVVKMHERSPYGWRVCAQKLFVLAGLHKT